MSIEEPPVQGLSTESTLSKSEKLAVLQEKLAQAEKAYQDVDINYDDSFQTARYTRPYYGIARDEAKAEVTTESLREKIEKSNDTNEEPQETVLKFIQEQNRQKAENEASERIASSQKEIDRMNTETQKYEKLVSDREVEMESIRQERLLARQEAEKDPSNTEAARKSENLRMHLKDVSSEYHRFADKLDELKEKSKTALPDVEERMRVWQEKKIDIEKHPENYSAIPKNVDEDPDFADALKSARFSSSEDEERYRINTKYDEQKAAREIFARRFPEKWEFYQRLNAKANQQERDVPIEETSQRSKIVEVQKNDALAGNVAETSPKTKEEPKLSPETITNSYKTVYADGRMRTAFESLASRAYPDRRTYEPNSPQSQSIFETVLTRDANSLSQFEELVAKEFERRNKNQEEINDSATPDYRKKMLEDDALISGQMDPGIENLARTLFNQEIDLSKYRKETKEKPVEKSAEQEPASLREDAPKPESVPERKIENEPPVSAEKKSDPVEEEKVAPPAQEKFKSNEFIRDHIVENYLSYQDADLPPEVKRRMLEWSKSEESAKKYAEAVEQMAHKESLNRLQEKARELTDKMLIEAKRIGIPVSPHGKSISWAMWDLGKQFHYFTHQDEADPKYEIANPLLSEKKREEIINRHLGYEAYAAFNSPQSPEYKNRIVADKRFGKALELFNKAPNAKRTLSSKDLAELGALLRE